MLGRDRFLNTRPEDVMSQIQMDIANIPEGDLKRAGVEGSKVELTEEEIAKQVRKKKIIRRSVIAVVCVALIAIGAIVSTKYYFIPKSHYDTAMVNIEKSDYAGAYYELNDLDYSDSKEQFAKVIRHPETKAQLLADVKAGSTVLFGTYKYMPYMDDVRPVEWEVLERDGNKALLISKYVLDCAKFHENDDLTFWGKSTLRGWLNNEFYDEVFSKAEKKAIDQVPNTPGVEDTGNLGNNDTKDRVFLLSAKELAEYFNDSTSRQCEGTDLAVTYLNGIRSYIRICNWWLRSTDQFGMNAMYVNAEGQCEAYGAAKTTEGIGIRPAIWIDLAKAAGNEK